MRLSCGSLSFCTCELSLCPCSRPCRSPRPPAFTRPRRPPPPPPKATTANLQLSDDLARACTIEFNDVEQAPKFEFDKSALLYQDRAVLDQIASCVTTGALKGRALKLVGHADARGEAEYNMALGDQRAGSARKYLLSHGVDKAKIAETSRGELDATGTDVTGWEKDRRVDIVLEH
jgi:peptidoglycan-associated lipoprotein